MFILSQLEDKVPVAPQDLGKPTAQAITAVLERTYLDKVIKDLGLVVTIYDIQDIQGGAIYPGDGAAHFVVRFRLVVFRPFVGEVLIGKLTKSTRDGLQVSLGFFSDISVPEFFLQEPSLWDDSEKLWLWKFEGADLYMDLQETVRFRVSAVKFHPIPSAAHLQIKEGQEPPVGTAGKPFAPMEVVGDINGDGLGLLSWWGGGEEAAEGAE